MSHEPTRESLIEAWFDDGGDPARHDPVRAARVGLKRALPKRFYSDVSVLAGEEGHVLHLDGRAARTKGRNLLAAENAAAATLLAREWREQGAEIDPASMPVTRILHAAIDHVADHLEAVAADIHAYAGSDLVCYRAGEPERLVALQARLWDPVLAHAHAAYGARLVLVEGIGHVAQPEPALRALGAPVGKRAMSPARLAALHVLTTISGSALIALAVADRALEPEAGFDAGEVDADFVVSVWGIDEEAAARRANRRADFLAAAALLHALEG
jgi:chaperone required for assembly of F1-ATPase